MILSDNQIMKKGYNYIDGSGKIWYTEKCSIGGLYKVSGRFICVHLSGVLTGNSWGWRDHSVRMSDVEL